MCCRRGGGKGWWGGRRLAQWPEQSVSALQHEGGAIVVQDTTDYIAEAERQLGNAAHNKKMDNDPTVSRCGLAVRR